MIGGVNRFPGLYSRRQNQEVLRENNILCYGTERLLLYILEEYFMSMEKIKKFVKDHKTEIIYFALIGASSFALGVAGFKLHKWAVAKNFKAKDGWFIQLCKDFDEAAKDCNAYVLAKPEELWAAFDKDGNLVDCVRDPDGKLLNPKMLMVFGDEVKK
jgi:hypothetical protein